MRNEADHKQKKRNRSTLLTVKHISAADGQCIPACLPLFQHFDKTQRKTSTRPRISSVPEPDYDIYEYFARALARLPSLGQGRMSLIHINLASTWQLKMLVDIWYNTIISHV